MPRHFVPSVNEVMKLIIGKVENLNKLSVVIFEDMQESLEPFLNQPLAVRGNVEFNPYVVLQGDRLLRFIKMKKQTMAWVMQSTSTNRELQQQPRF